MSAAAASLTAPLGERLCEVWVADHALHRPAYDALLDEAERARAEAFVRPVDRISFVLGVALLKMAVAGVTNASPASIRVDRRCDECGRAHARPRIRGADLHVSVSRSGSLVAVALTRVGPVGVDIERHAAGRTAALARQILTATEPVSRREDILTYWCRKESVVKATGQGLRVPLKDVVVSPAADPAQLVSYQGRELAASLVDLDLDARYTAALTVLTDGDVTVEVRAADALLGR